ncbi:uncharacterized protein LOC131989906 [Centropristis striata]|uniref:uncharacterized protein LOC131989906 n=1 Tax=Centropristis striata TaxID=184440 RepID=UPI0027E04A8A|nr:uncharacterized protein LOC131989906 [Centropristis striata]
MELKDSLVKGGVLINHQIHEGKHQYEVENVVKYRKAIGKKAFVRRGDKLMQINGMDLQDVTPEEFAHLLAKENPMLTVHKASKMKAPTEQSFPAEDTLHPVSKESITLSFRMEMRREEDLERDGGGKEDGQLEVDGCPEENDLLGEGGDLLIVSMTKTSISVVRGRGCDTGSTCSGCHGTGCTFNDVVVVSESSEVMLVPRGGGSFRHLKSLNTPIQHAVTHNYLQGLCSERTIYASENQEDMTIYVYKSIGPTKGLPVVINFTKSSCFLRCCQEGERVFLQVETCDKQRLKNISRSDETALSFVFYMKNEPPNQKRFESALYGGWFIQIANVDKPHKVDIATLDGKTGEESFLFIIKP